MKKSGTEPPAGEGKKRGCKPGTKVAAVAPRPAALSASPVDLIDKTFTLAAECGGIAQLKRLVDWLAQRWLTSDPLAEASAAGERGVSHGGIVVYWPRGIMSDERQP
jgi:hypothetical protein